MAVCALNSGQQTVDVGLRDLGVKRLFVGVIVVVAAVVGMCVCDTHLHLWAPGLHTDPGGIRTRLARVRMWCGKIVSITEQL